MQGKLKKTIVKKQKFERILAWVLIVLLSPILLLRALWALLSSKTLFRYQTMLGYQKQEIRLRIFAGPGWGRRLARLFNVVQGDIDISGNPPIDSKAKVLPEDAYFSYRLGIFSAYQLRKKVGLVQESEVEVERDYLETWTPKSSFSLLGKSLLATVFSSTASTIPPRLNFFGISMFNGKMQDCLDWMFLRVVEKEKTTIAFVNADCLNKAYTDTVYYQDLQAFSEIYPDGIGIRVATKMLDTAMVENINGTDMFPMICERAADEKVKLFLLGGREGVADLVKQNMQELFPELQVAGTQHGYFLESDTEKVITDINDSGAEILLVAFGAPKQEHWIQEHSLSLHPAIQMGVGGCFDFYSGRIPRAPLWMRELGLEWGYRLKQEPGRMWQRYIIGNPLFVFRIWKLGKHRMNASSVTQYETEKLIHHFSELERGKWRHQANFAIKKYSWIAIILLARFLKRALDIVVSGLGLIVLAPFILVLALAIRLESPGSAFYSQMRVGKYGTLFKFWKFRSMRQDSDELRAELVEDGNEMEGGVIFKMKDDPRITKIGKFIRKYSIDELPQLWNVFIGDMSLVGPRPAMPDEVKQYTALERKRLAVTPGITGIWQVSGRSDIPFDEQVKLDEEYIQSQSFWQDILILLKTIPAVVLGKGAY